MNLSINRILNIAALTVFASTGLMQAAEQATFHLSVPAHWGLTELQPGDYKMSLPSLSAGKSTFQVMGADRSFFEMPLVTTINNVSDSSFLKLVSIDGSYFVREFSSGPKGEVFTFPVPKPTHHQEMARGGSSVMAVTVN